MINFVPNIVVLDYLTSVDKLTPEIAEKAKSHLETGYQKQLTYKHADGSYSAFGKSDKSGSTWLTAYVAKSFSQASKYIQIDEKHINDAMKFLNELQMNDGSFPEVGYMLSKSMQGGASGKGVALTAYVVITFLENPKYAKKHKSSIDKALNYIKNNIEDVNDNYSLAVVAYALQLAKHSERSTFFDKLNAKSISSDGKKFWKKNMSSRENLQDKTTSLDIEITAYALLAFTEAGESLDAVSIMRWLISQRNENGGFKSTQDTVVGLQALARLTEMTNFNNNVKIEINNESNDSNTQIKINQANSLTLQKFELPSNAREFKVLATGSGMSLLQISHRYNIVNSKISPQFTLKPKVESLSNKEFLHLTVCTSFISNDDSETSNMAIMEVKLPSGFTFDSDDLPDLLSSEKVKKVEVKDKETLVVVYFDDIGRKEICPAIKAYQTHPVAKQKQPSIIIYDYYDSCELILKFS
jgi:CD109 antigen